MVASSWPTPREAVEFEGRTEKCKFICFYRLDCHGGTGSASASWRRGAQFASGLLVHCAECHSLGHLSPGICTKQLARSIPLGISVLLEYRRREPTSWPQATSSPLTMQWQFQFNSYVSKANQTTNPIKSRRIGEFNCRQPVVALCSSAYTAAAATVIHRHCAKISATRRAGRHSDDTSPKAPTTFTLTWRLSLSLSPPPRLL